MACEEIGVFAASMSRYRSSLQSFPSTVFALHEVPLTPEQSSLLFDWAMLNRNVESARNTCFFAA